MWLTSKIKQVIMVLRPGVVTLAYPFAPHPVAKDFRGNPVWDHHKCVGCGGCAAHCPARTIMIRDICQEVRVMLYDGSRCTYCGRCSDVCPEKAITMTENFELATGDKNDVTVNMELFMLTCQRCGRCYNLETTNVIDRMYSTGFKYDNLETRAFIQKMTDTLDTSVLAETKQHQRPTK